VPDLPVFLSGILRRANQLEVWAWLGVIQNVWKKHGLHFHRLHNCSLPPNVVAMRTVFVAQKIVCSAFEVLPSVAFRLRVFPVSELVRTPRRSWRRVRAAAPNIV